MNKLKTDIFSERRTIHPYEYPQLIKYASAIHESFWTPEHFTYDRDVNDFIVKLNDVERTVVTRSMLSIGIVENRVKTFWSRIDMRMPKTEIAIVGHTFAGNEVIHQISYEKLLTLLGLEKEFEKVSEVPCMQGRSEYLGKYLQGVYSKSNKEFTKSLILFTLLVENVSLFSQFLIVSSFKKHKNMLTNFNSIISATAREENLHAKFGEELVNIIRKQEPEWFDDEMESKIRRNIKKALTAEIGVLDWIFEKGELPFLPKESIVEYLKSRFNKSLNQIGYKDEFIIKEELLEPTEFLEVQLMATASFDFFNEKSTDYSQNASFDEEDIWDEN
jgi:ribonucleoside-diphosphate reductase beta chain